MEKTENLNKNENNMQDLKPLNVIVDGLSRLSDEELRHLDEVITPESAKLLAKAFGEEILELIGPLYLNDEDEDVEGENAQDAKENAAPSSVSKEEAALQAMVKDPRYWRDQDPQFIAQVTKGFERLYPNK